MSRIIRASVRAALQVGGVLSLSTLTLGVSNAADDNKSQDKLEEVVVTGFRASLIDALDTKKNSAEMVDVINAEDIAKFPDANLAESLQRLPGIALDRDNGEGRSI